MLEEGGEGGERGGDEEGIVHSYLIAFGRELGPSSAVWAAVDCVGNQCCGCPGGPRSGSGPSSSAVYCRAPRALLAFRPFHRTTAKQVPGPLHPGHHALLVRSSTPSQARRRCSADRLALSWMHGSLIGWMTALTTSWHCRRACSPATQLVLTSRRSGFEG